jgi:hypothetical protein
MTHYKLYARKAALVALACSAMMCIAPAYAAPGAHGPNGEHLDTPGAGQHQHADTNVPRMEAASETFEIVGRLEDGELSILVDRFETNEPVLGGKVEVESNGIKAEGKFHMDHGDYAFTDERLLKALAQPGKHPLVFTVFAGNDSDLLQGTLDVTAAHHDDHGHDHVPGWVWKAGIAAMGVLLVGGLWLRRRSTNSKTRRDGGVARS